MDIEPSDRKRQARFAGGLFLLWIITGLFGLMYLPSRISRTGDTVTVVGNILANEGLFRVGILVDVFAGVLWMLLVLAFYGLFRSVSQRWSRLLVAFVLVQIPVAIAMQALDLTALRIIKGDWSFAFTPDRAEEMAMLLLRIKDQATVVLQAFWGLWLIPLAVLVLRSRFLPRFLGVWLAINGLAYLALFTTGICAPQHSAVVYKLAMPAFFGEMALMLWLVVMGSREQRTDTEMEGVPRHDRGIV